jgi:hypothetical protein
MVEGQGDSVAPSQSTNSLVTGTVSPSADGGDYRNLGTGRHGSGKLARVSDILVSHKDVDVFSDFALFGYHAIADARVARPQPFESIAQRSRAYVDFYLALPTCKGTQRTRNLKRHRHG